MGDEPNTLFAPSFGLLLRDDLHHSFDRGQWALWPQVRASRRGCSLASADILALILQGDGYVVHVLWPTKKMQGLHGKILPRERFRCDDYRLPRADLLMFHYQQCAQRYFRGFSEGM
jgi:HNH endonuclease